MRQLTYRLDIGRETRHDSRPWVPTKLQQAVDYVESLVERDISRVDWTLRDAERARRLLRSYARLQGTQATAAVIRADLVANADGDRIKEETIYSYLSALRKLFAIEDANAWCPNLRCKTPIRTTDTRYFVDPSIAAAALEAGPDDLLSDLPSFGLLFETLVVRDLRIYAAASDGGVFHYRDKQERECDAVVKRRGGKYGLVEVKLGGSVLVEEGHRGKRRFRWESGRINASRFSIRGVPCATLAWTFRFRGGRTCAANPASRIRRNRRSS